jgi:hypothetical protein
MEETKKVSFEDPRRPNQEDMGGLIVPGRLLDMGISSLRHGRGETRFFWTTPRPSRELSSLRTTPLWILETLAYLHNVLFPLRISRV